MATKDEKEPTAEAAKEANQTPKGRAAFMAIMQAQNPDYAPANDDQLFDDAHAQYSAKDAELTKHRDSNSRLAARVSQDPKAGAFLSMFAGDDPKSIPYAYGKVFGKDGQGLEGDEAEEFEKGYQENLAKMAESQKLQEQASKNIEKSMTALDKYCTDNNKTDAEKGIIRGKGFDLADNMLNGIISKDNWAVIDKGNTYDKDIQDAADTGLVEGKNQVIDNKMKNISKAPMPDLGNGTGAGKVIPVKTQVQNGGNFFSGFPGKR
jgi:hypothetical protein